MSLKAFREAMQRGDVVTALVVAPFSYTSHLIDGKSYQFIIEDGPAAGVSAFAPTLDEAVRIASYTLLDDAASPDRSPSDA